MRGKSCCQLKSNSLSHWRMNIAVLTFICYAAAFGRFKRCCFSNRHDDERSWNCELCFTDDFVGGVGGRIRQSSDYLIRFIRVQFFNPVVMWIARPTIDDCSLGKALTDHLCLKNEVRSILLVDKFASVSVEKNMWVQQDFPIGHSIITCQSGSGSADWLEC